MDKKMMKWTLLILSCSLITACTYHRFESIATCEFESREFWSFDVWRSSNCLGQKEANSHLKESVKEIKNAKE